MAMKRGHWITLSEQVMYWCIRVCLGGYSLSLRGGIRGVYFVRTRRPHSSSIHNARIHHTVTNVSGD